eukprot:jgi/Botrbrau1/20283/Bobra.31_1s0066.1
MTIALTFDCTAAARNETSSAVTGGVYEVEAILAKKRVRKSWKYLAKWAGYDESESTWKPLANVCHLTDVHVHVSGPAGYGPWEVPLCLSACASRNRKGSRSTSFSISRSSRA